MLRLCVANISSFRDFERLDGGLEEVLVVLEELIRELNCEVKDRVVEDEISLPPARFRCRLPPYRCESFSDIAGTVKVL